MSRTYGTPVAVVHGEGESRDERDHDAALPRRALAVRADDAVNERITDPILDLDVAHSGPAAMSV